MWSYMVLFLTQILSSQKPISQPLSRSIIRNWLLYWILSQFEEWTIRTEPRFAFGAKVYGILQAHMLLFSASIVLRFMVGSSKIEENEFSFDDKENEVWKLIKQI